VAALDKLLRILTKMGQRNVLRIITTPVDEQQYFVQLSNHCPFLHIVPVSNGEFAYSDSTARLGIRPGLKNLRYTQDTPSILNPDSPP
jgi:hypothetical protein